MTDKASVLSGRSMGLNGTFTNLRVEGKKNRAEHSESKMERKIWLFAKCIKL